MIIENEKQLAGCMEHTLLKATASAEQIRKLCQEAEEYGFYSVCVNRRWVEFAAAELRGSNIKVTTPISFPLGVDSIKIKVAQAKDAIMAGADELDMVADLSAIIEEDARYLTKEFKSVLKVCRAMRPAVVLKVIIEAAALTEAQKIFVCYIANKCDVDYIKTSTGLNPAGGANVEDVELIKEVAPLRKIKAAGGIKTLEQVRKMLAAGATRIGTSSAIEIIMQYRAEKGK